MFDIQKSAKILKMTFSSALQNIDRAADELRIFLTGIGKKSQAFHPLLITREALINAITHGNHCDEKKSVSMSIVYQPEQLEIDVTDEGKGFSWDATMSKECDDTQDHGRGLQIMKLYSQQIQYNSKGNQVKLTIKFPEKKE
ncbi:MAG: ATP-binding protein [Candidatus Magnetomorum sp.]|nr:ATP-binding protein [Candidatus Magnetomorum sp.]